MRDTFSHIVQPRLTYPTDIGCPDSPLNRYFDFRITNIALSTKAEARNRAVVNEYKELDKN
jgi:hypothetical protein